MRRLLHTSLGTIQNRIELIGIELQEEKTRFAEVFLWTAAAAFLAMLGLAVLTVGIAFLVGDSARPYFLLGAGLLYLAAAAAAFLILRNKLRNGPPPFSETVAQFKKDRQWLGSPKEK